MQIYNFFFLFCQGTNPIKECKEICQVTKYLVKSISHESSQCFAQILAQLQNLFDNPRNAELLDIYAWIRVREHLVISAGQVCNNQSLWLPMMITKFKAERQNLSDEISEVEIAN